MDVGSLVDLMSDDSGDFRKHGFKIHHKQNHKIPKWNKKSYFPL